jgi:hypothetical protein
LYIDPQIKCDFHLPKKEKQKKSLESVTSYSQGNIGQRIYHLVCNGETSSFVLIASATTHDNSHASELLPGSLLSLLPSSCRAKVDLLFFFFSFSRDFQRAGGEINEITLRPVISINKVKENKNPPKRRIVNEKRSSLLYELKSLPSNRRKPIITEEKIKMTDRLIMAASFFFFVIIDFFSFALGYRI